jgi:AcrR family transcriptional regulator
MSGGESLTRQRLIRSAELVFARDGIAAASLREITRESGTRNVTAIKYHFGDREALLTAVLDKHSVGLDRERNSILDQYEANAEHYRAHPAEGLRALASALVQPYASKLDDPDGGPEFLQIFAATLAEGGPRRDASGAVAMDAGLARWRPLVDPYLDDEAVRVHRRFTAVSLTSAEMARRARTGPHADSRLFVSSLTDAVTGILAQPTSAETAVLLDEHFNREVERQFGLMKNVQGPAC